ncbi:MAG: VWA domain-containing protein [SAR324 cluster bacterium]|nr:VWA domain-containing protein [SAR324 cluster bacterium]
MLSEFHFLRPLWLLAIPLVWWLVFRLLGKWWSTANWERIVEPHLLQFLAITPAKQKASLLPWIMCFAGTLLLLALAGPVWEKVPQPLLQKSQARVLVLDLSFSMLATDIKPTRLDRARFKLEDLLKRFVEGDTALIAYAGEAFVISPLTHDPATIAALLPGLHPNIMPVPGSRAEQAFSLAGNLLSRSKSGSGHIIWITDGIEGQDFATLENTVGRNRLSILAVGTESGSPVALSEGGFLKDKNGAIVIPKLNSQPLEKLADIKQGSFTVLSIDDRDVEGIIEAETTATDFIEDEQLRGSDKWNEEGPWLLLLALPLAASLFRRGLLFSWSLLLLFGISSLPNSAQAFGWDDLWLRTDQQAEKLFQEGAEKDAAQLFENPEWKGTAAYRTGDYEKAIEEFSRKDRPLANFNRGNSLAFAGRLEEALAAYEKVLAENPQHEDAQFNHDLIENILQEQQKKQQNKKADKGKENEQRKNKQDQQQDSSKADAEQNEKSSQQLSAEKQDSGDPQSSTEEKNNDKKQSNEGEKNLNDKTDSTEAKKNENEQKKNNKLAEKNIASGDEQELTPDEQSRQQTLEQWLRKIPDDPGRLLRNKMQREYQRRGKQQIFDEQYW